MPTTEITTEITNYLTTTGITQAELARRLGIPPTMLNNWVRGKHRPSQGWQIILRQQGIISEGGESSKNRLPGT